MTSYEKYVSVLKRKINNKRENLLFVCIGTNKVVYDSIGPLVGSYLIKQIDENMVIGHMKKTFCNKIDFIYNYPKIIGKFVVAIDVAVAKNKEHEEEIFISDNPIVMGLALKRNKGIVGNVGIKVVIPEPNSIDETYVKNRAKFVSRGIVEAIYS